MHHSINAGSAQDGEPPSGAVVAAAQAAHRRAVAASVRRFSLVLLATALSSLIVVADRMVDAWTSGGLLLALLVLWLSVFGGLLLFERLCRRLAVRLMATWRDATARPGSSTVHLLHEARPGSRRR